MLTWRPSTGTCLGWWVLFTKVVWKEGGSESLPHQRPLKCPDVSPSPQVEWFNRQVTKKGLHLQHMRGGLSPLISPVDHPQALGASKTMESWGRQEVLKGKVRQGSSWASVRTALFVRPQRSWWQCISRSITPVSPGVNGALHPP